MKKGFEILEKFLMKPMGKISQYKIVRAVMAAGMASIPFTIVGSMFLVLNILPLTFPGLEGIFANSVFRVSDLYMIANTSTMGILSLYFAFVIGYELTKIEESEEGLKVSPINGALLSVFAFFMTLPELMLTEGKMQLVNIVSDAETVVSGLRIGGTVERLGTAGVFTAILMSVLATQLYFLCVRRNWTVKMPETVPLGVSRSFTALVPSFVIAFAVLLLNGILVFFGTDIYNIIAIPFGFVVYLTDSWWGVMVILFLIHALWIVGIHGANIISAFTLPIMLINMTANLEGANIVFAGEFNNSFVILGGSGATLGLTIFISFLAKSEQLKVLGRASLVPSFFNINEPIIFGLPIVYNPYLAIPFFLAPMVSATIAYIAISTEIVRPIIAQVPWPSPAGLGAFIGTAGDWKAAVLALIAVVVAFLIYFPFIKYYDTKLVADEHAKAVELASAQE